MRIFSTLIIISIFIAQKSISQNVGIGTTTPQTTLDVKGNFRSGGSNNFITHDSASGKITWSNSYLFVPAPQYLIQHSASAEGLYYNSGQLEYRNQLGVPAFFTNWTNGNGYFSGKLGIGVLPTTAPLGFSQGLGDKISLYPNSSVNYGFGVQPSLLQIHTDLPAADIAFGYGSSTSFTETMRIKGSGNVGIGTISPNAPLGFPPLLGKKITLYPGATGDVGFAVAGNRLQIYSDNPSADVAIGYDAAGTFNERFAFKPNGALAVNGNTGITGQVLQSNGSGAPASWSSSSAVQYNNINEINGTGPVTVAPSGGVETDLPGMAITLTVPTTSKVLLSFNVPMQTNGCFGCGASIVQLYFTDNLVTIPGFSWSMMNSIYFQLSGSDLYTLTPGTHNIKLVAVVSFLGSSASVTFGNTTPPATETVNNMIVQVIPQ